MTDFLKKLAAFKSSPAVWAQTIHFLTGQVVMLWANVLHWNLLIVGLSFSVFVIIVEFWYDRQYEANQNIREDVKDTVFYMFGLWSAFGLLRL